MLDEDVGDSVTKMASGERVDDDAFLSWSCCESLKSKWWRMCCGRVGRSQELVVVAGGVAAVAVSVAVVADGAAVVVGGAPVAIGHSRCRTRSSCGSRSSTSR